MTDRMEDATLIKISGQGKRIEVRGPIRLPDSVTLPDYKMSQKTTDDYVHTAQKYGNKNMSDMKKTTHIYMRNSELPPPNKINF